MLDDFDDDDDTDPWNLDSKNKLAGGKSTEVKPLDLKAPVSQTAAAASNNNAQKKNDNPFD